jgi:predicted amidohydrolase
MKNIQLSKELGFLRVGMALLGLRVADVDFNVGAIINTVRKAKNQDVQILALPEIAIAGHTIGDLLEQLFHQPGF